MIRPFEVILTVAAAQILAIQPGGARFRLERWLAHLGRFPDVEGDFRDPDRHERIHQVKLVGECLVTWWVDHGDRTVRVVEIEPVIDEK